MVAVIVKWLVHCVVAAITQVRILVTAPLVFIYNTIIIFWSLFSINFFFHISQAPVMSSFVLIFDVMFLSSVFDLFHLSSLYCFQFSLVTLHQKRENHEKIKSLFSSPFPNFILIHVNFCAEKKH